MWWIYALLSAFFAALTTIFAKIGVVDVSPNLATAIRTVVILLLTWAIIIVTGESSEIQSISRRSLTFLVLSGLATGLSWLCYFQALQTGLASAVASLDKTSLVMTLILAMMVLGEPFQAKALIGIALILAGTVVLIW
ncbi:MAG TPA: EamA family transporter [Nitrospiraceae bacterium]|nr:EamA family transporter [Nitrospiraceae bacterium]